ncbi:MAG: SusE domain-containing protein [Prevotella sp.]|nr:SusE domain-containing protein [Bacteroides sp.]MCM1366217.1 SusE domain-containing protein [Prevotella sp.]MCM1436969.1 SusE domain-containing protein [Prevotella sp.]
MKKIAFLMMALGVMLGLGSCSEDRDPVYKAPTNFVLNTPAMADQYIELTEGQILELSASQPDYGYAAVAKYSAQMSLTEDFAEAYDLEAIDGTANLARFAVSQNDVAVGLCNLLGIDSEEAYNEMFPDGNMDAKKVYFRAVCEIEGIADSKINSNVVSYNQLVGFFAIPVPGSIYLVGSPEGWAGPTESNAAHYAEWRLFEADDAIGSKVYSGVFDMPAAPMFRFYTALTGWDADSYGSQVDDNPIDVNLVDGSLSTTIVKGKGSFNFPNFTGGKMTVIVDMSDANNMVLTVMEGEHIVTTAKYMYVIGTISGWKEPSEANETALNPYRVADTTGDGIYTGTFDVTAGTATFRLYSALTGWDGGDSLGSQAEDSPVEASLTNGVYSGPYVSGKGSWDVAIPSDGKLTIIVDTNQKTVNFVFN